SVPASTRPVSSPRRSSPAAVPPPSTLNPQPCNCQLRYPSTELRLPGKAALSPGARIPQLPRTAVPENQPQLRNALPGARLPTQRLAASADPLLVEGDVLDRLAVAAVEEVEAAVRRLDDRRGGKLARLALQVPHVAPGAPVVRGDPQAQRRPLRGGVVERQHQVPVPQADHVRARAGIGDVRPLRPRPAASGVAGDGAPEAP